MRREGVWEETIKTLREELAKLAPQDSAAIVAFDQRPQLVVSPESFAEDRAVAENLFQEQKPSWGAGDLGAALVMAAGVIEQFADVQGAGGIEKRVVIVSDMQATSDLAALRGFTWPTSIQTELRGIQVKSESNASIGVLPDGDGVDAQADGKRVRVTNSAGARQGQFQWRWLDSKLQPIASGSEGVSAVTVPSEKTKVVSVENPPKEAVAIELVGDDEPFDNRYWVVGVEPEQSEVLYLGERVSDPREDLFYFLERVALDTPSRTIKYSQASPGESLRVVEKMTLSVAGRDPYGKTALIVVHDFDQEWTGPLRDYVESGGNLLWVFDSTNAAESSVLQGLQKITEDESIQIVPSPPVDYRLLSQIEFNAPLFAPFADPRFADFSKVQFWRTQRLVVDEGALRGDETAPQVLRDRWKVLARFDDGDIAIAERSVGSGNISVLTAGWQPSESQLALSSKFVPLISGWIVPRSSSSSSLQLLVGQKTPGEVGDDTPAEFDLQCGMGDDNDPVSVVAGAELTIPGVYSGSSDGGKSDEFAAFVVNIDARESSVDVFDQSELEQYGITFTDQQREIQKASLERQMQDRELEEQQQWWRALLLFALGILGLETLLGLRRRNTSDVEAGLPATP